MPSSHLILCRPLLLLPPIPPSIRVFSNESTLHMRWSKYWNFSFSISLSNEHSGLISFRMDWLDLLAVQGILKSLLQQHSSKASILRHSAFFIVQLSHPYMTTAATAAAKLLQSCLTLDCNMPGFPVHQLLEPAQTHIHRVGDAIQLSHPLLSPSPPAPNPSQHQGLFK